jgi:glycine betaine/proline transport system substrate-binding protein
MRHLHRVAAAFALTLVLGLAHAQSDCFGLNRPIVFAELGYGSADILTELARIVLEDGLGCATTTIPGATLPILQGMIRGDVDVNMEIWTDNTPDAWREALAAGRVRELSPVFDDAAQGFYVPRYLVEGDAARGIAALAPDLRSVADLPGYAALFRDPEQPNRGRLHNCVIGWYCEGINNVKIVAYGLDAHFTNFRPGTGIALETSMAAAYARGEPWLGYYWEPTGILGRLDMLRLDEPPYDPDCFAAMNALADEPERATLACDYPIVIAVVGLGARLAAAIPDPVAAFLDAIYLPTSIINELLATLEADDRATPRDVALAFLRDRSDVWGAWLSDDERSRLAATLD